MLQIYLSLEGKYFTNMFFILFFLQIILVTKFKYSANTHNAFQLQLSSRQSSSKFQVSAKCSRQSSSTSNVTYTYPWESSRVRKGNRSPFHTPYPGKGSRGECLRARIARLYELERCARADHEASVTWCAVGNIFEAWVKWYPGDRDDTPEGLRKISGDLAGALYDAVMNWRK